MTAILQRWEHVARGAGIALVLPDGCRDLILYQAPHCAPKWRYSPLQARPECVAVAPGTRLTGFRLMPGTYVSEELRNSLGPDADAAVADIHVGADWNTGAAEAISALKTAQTVADAARSCGVSERTMRRMLVHATGCSPIFWMRLARARRAAIAGEGDLAEIAADHGYADQAHMTRDFRQWFGLTPRALRADADLLAQLSQPALATGEQISTR